MELWKKLWKKLKAFLDPKQTWSFENDLWILVLLVAGLGVGLVVGIGSQESEPELSFEEKVHELETQSLRGTEYFNSSFYDDIKNTAKADTVMNAGKLKARLKEPNRQYLLTLLALRATNRDSLDAVRPTLKTGILIDALNQATYFNAWGVPHLYWTDTTFTVPAPDITLDAPVKAIIELDSLAIEPLITLLTKRRNAPRWGPDEGFRGREANEYRVADYALALIRRIQKKTFSTTRAGRDSLIQEYLGQIVID